MGQMAISSEQKENLALSLGKSFLRYNKVDSMNEIRTHIDNLTAEKLQAIAREIFDPEKLTILKYE